MSELGDVIIAKIGESASKINDYDQRSALGMTRSWLDNKTLDVWEPERGKDMIQYPRRDQLATDLVGIIEESGAEYEEVKTALAEARKHVNAPFFDPTMNGAKQRGASLKPKEKKSQREKGDK